MANTLPTSFSMPARGFVSPSGQAFPGNTGAIHPYLSGQGQHASPLQGQDNVYMLTNGDAVHFSAFDWIDSGFRNRTSRYDTIFSAMIHRKKLGPSCLSPWMDSSRLVLSVEGRVDMSRFSFFSLILHLPLCMRQCVLFRSLALSIPTLHSPSSFVRLFLKEIDTRMSKHEETKNYDHHALTSYLITYLGGFVYCLDTLMASRSGTSLIRTISTKLRPSVRKRKMSRLSRCVATR